MKELKKIESERREREKEEKEREREKGMKDERKEL